MGFNSAFKELNCACVISSPCGDERKERSHCNPRRS